MPKYKQTSDILKIMSNKKNIRNIGIIAHIDHGKCVDGDTRLSMTDGSILTAREIYNTARANCPVVKETRNEIIYDGQFFNNQVYSLNKDTGKIEPKPIKYIWKLKGGTLLKVKLRTGFEIATTPEHKYLTFNGIDFIEKRADQLEVGEYVISARNLTIEKEYTIKDRILRELGSAPGFYVTVSTEFKENLTHFLETFGFNKGVNQLSKLSISSFKSGLRKNRFRLEDIIQIADKFNLALHDLYDNVLTISYRSSKNQSFWHGKTSKQLILPKDFEEFFYLAGLMLGDGTREKLVVGKPDLTVPYSKICEDLGCTPYWRRYAGKCPELVSGGGLTLLMMLNRLFDYPVKQKSKNIRISDFVMKSSNPLVTSLLRGYFDTDGTVEKARSAISISSASQQILKDIHLLLLRFGCIGELQDDTLYLSGSSVTQFNNHIGFTINEKVSKSLALQENTKGSRIYDLIPIDGNAFRQIRGAIPKAKIGHHYYKYENLVYTPTRSTTQQMITNLKQHGAITARLNKIISNDIAFVEVIEINESYAPEVYDFTIDTHHNFIAEGMVIHNTTLTDSLLSNAGLLSPTIAGEARALDYLEEEQKRGITIKAANISLLHEADGTQYVINMIDTPGHVDFSGNVTRALRVIDGAVVVVDAVEEVMVQTETVTKQAVEERVRPILFINKIDRIIRELKLNAKQVQEKLFRIIRDFNELVRTYADKEYKEKWQVNAAKGTVAFGSALHGWGFTLPQIQAAGMKFDDIVDAYNQGTYKSLKDKLPVHAAILEMVVSNAPNPLEAQPYRIQRIWHGDLEGELGQAMIKADDDGPLIMCLNNVTVDPHAGVVATGRVFSGSIGHGDQIYLILGRKAYRVQQVSMYMGAKREVVDKINAGNIAALLGLDLARAGETVVADGIQKDIPPFERIRYVSEPVVTIAVDPKHARDLPKLVDVMGKMGVMDPNLVTTINKETGEYLLSGMGELHLEIAVKDIQKAGLDVTTSPPIVVYRETVKGASAPVLAKSPNKHNRIWVSAEPMDEKTQELITSGKVSHLMDSRERTRILREEASWDAKKARNIWGIDQFVNVMIDSTKGVQYLREIQDTFLSGWNWATEAGPQCGEPLRGVIFRLTDSQLHEDSIHRGPAQVMPMARKAVFGSFLTADPAILEPIYKIQVRIPPEYIGAVSSVISQRRGQITNIEQKGPAAFLTGTIPVAETFGLASDLRSKTSGHAFWQTQFDHWAFVPTSLQPEVIEKIRKRRGLSPGVPSAEQYMDKL